MIIDVVVNVESSLWVNVSVMNVVNSSSSVMAE
jgi:hypothetical protein